MTGREYLTRNDLHPFYDERHQPLVEDVVDAFEQGKAEGYKEASVKVSPNSEVTITLSTFGAKILNAKNKATCEHFRKFGFSIDEMHKDYRTDY